MSELMNSRRPFDRLFRLSQPVKNRHKNRQNRLLVTEI